MRNEQSVGVIPATAWIRRSGPTILGVYSSKRSANADVGLGGIAEPLPGDPAGTAWVLGVVTIADTSLLFHGLANDFTVAANLAANLGGEVRLVRAWGGEGRDVVVMPGYSVVDS